MRMMPGVAVAALLAIVFGRDSLPPGGRKGEALPTRGVSIIAEDGGAVPMEFFTAFSSPATEPATRAAVSAPRLPASLHIAAQQSAGKAVLPPTAPGTPASPGTARPAPGTEKSSETAYASLSGGGSASSVRVPSLDDIPSGLPPPLLPDYSPLPPPFRGLRAFARGGLFRARQEPDFFGRDNAAYAMRGETCSLGLNYDWSPDTVLAASVEKLSATTESRHPHDARQTRTDGVLFHAGLETILFSASILKLNAFHGTLDHEGDGTIGNALSSSPWREDRHSSRMYGVSAAVSLPLLFWGYRVVMDSRVDFARITTGAYTHQTQGPWSVPVRVDGFSSQSLAFSSSTAMARDFLSRLGLVTLRAGAGFGYEMSGTAGGVRSLNALAAAPMPYMAAGFVGNPSRFRCAWSGMYHVSAGLDYQSPGGWSWSAEYRRDFSAAYSRDSLRLEAGRSF